MVLASGIDSGDREGATREEIEEREALGAPESTKTKTPWRLWLPEAGKTTIPGRLDAQGDCRGARRGGGAESLLWVAFYRRGTSVPWAPEDIHGGVAIHGHPRSVARSLGSVMDGAVVGVVATMLQ